MHEALGSSEEEEKVSFVSGACLLTSQPIKPGVLTPWWVEAEPAILTEAVDGSCRYLGRAEPS